MSLLLDALRQAEKNKASPDKNTTGAKKEQTLENNPDKDPNSHLGLADHPLLPDFDLSENNLQDNSQLNTENKNETLVELEVLSDDDLATEDLAEEKPEIAVTETESANYSNKSEATAKSFKHNQKLTLTTDNTEPENQSDSIASAKTAPILELTDNNEEVNPVIAEEVDPNDDFDYSTEQSISNTAKSKSKTSTDKTDFTHSIKKNIANAIESSEKIALVSKVNAEDTEIEKKPKTANTIEATNILQSSGDSKKYRNYGLFFFFLLILAAGYLYYLSIPQSVETSSLMPEELAIPEFGNNSINSNTLTTLAVNQQVLSNNNQIAENTSNTNPALAVMAKPEKKSIQNLSPINNKSNSFSSNSSLSDFIVEADENEIDYPKPVKIKIKKQSSAIKRNLHSAYSAYKNQRYDQAESLYKHVLHDDKVNLDALLALGAIAEQKGQLVQAKQFYQKVLRLKGSHIIARNALIRLHQSQTPSENESLYKSLIQQFPSHAEAHLSLANSYAVQQRWHEAQTEYFKAVKLNPNNADFQYNLAISLEQISKNQEALKYYRTALQLSLNNHYTFDKAVVKLRIQQLQE